MTAFTADRRVPSRRLGMKILSALLTAACALALLMAVERLQPPSEWRAAPATRIEAPNWLVRAREAVWPAPVVRADAGDALLTGRFAATDGVGPAVRFNGALIRIEGGETLRTRPWRIAAGAQRHAVGQTYARTLAAAPDAQIELREIVPVDAETPVPALAACGDRAPGLAGLLHRGDRVQVMFFRQGATPGPDASPTAVCAIWSLARE